MRVPLDMLAEIEAIAAICHRPRSWVFVRALKSCLAAEGSEVIEIAKAQRAIDKGPGCDFDGVIDEVDATAKGAAA
jgi:predicted transcriptional regulator